MTGTEQPTRVRHIVVASAALMSLLLYLDRFCISFVEMYIQEDLGLSDSQVGWMLSAFFWTYALGQVPSGWLTDRFGSRIMLTAYVLLWSLFTGLTGAVSAFAALLILRLGFGAAQAGAYPTASSIVSKWVPFQRRGTASGVIAFGGRVGGVLALFASGYIIVWLTPANTPSLLSTADLQNGPRLCYELSDEPHPEEAPATVRGRTTIRESLPASAQQLVRHHAQRYALVAQQIRTHDGEAVDHSRIATVIDPKLSAADTKTLVTGLNTVISTRGVFNEKNTQGLALEQEARRLLQDPPALNQRASERANRLVVEALHPACVKKLYVAGWRPMMSLYGALGVIVAVLIWQNCRTTPAEHPGCNAAEAALITGGSPPASGRLEAAPLRPLLRSRSMWCSCLSQWFTNIGWVFLVTWAPRYFSSVHRVPVEERAILVAIPPLVGWAGMLAGGLITDRAARRLGLRWGRAMPIALSRFLAMAAYIACLFEPGVTAVVLLFSIVAFATDLGTASSWAFTQDVGGRHVGSVLGWGNMWGNLGAAVTPPLLIWIVADGESWNNAFLACGAAFLLSGIAALGIDASIPITPTDPDRPEFDSGDSSGESAQ